VVTEYAEDVAEGKIDTEDLLERLPIPGVLEGADWEDYEGWTAGRVRTIIAAMAQVTHEDPKELLEAATDGARRDVIGKVQAAQRVEQDLEKMSRERILPRVEILEKVARYETYLSRQLYKALHELEALQTRRLGGQLLWPGYTCKG
jgi:hypothetical protein